MEDEGLLDPSDEIHLYCLQTIFVPRINQHLAVWQGSWNSHPLSSCSNRSPMQLWIEGQPVQQIPHQTGVCNHTWLSLITTRNLHACNTSACTSSYSYLSDHCNGFSIGVCYILCYGLHEFPICVHFVV